MRSLNSPACSRSFKPRGNTSFKDRHWTLNLRMAIACVAVFTLGVTARLLEMQGLSSSGRHWPGVRALLQRRHVAGPHCSAPRRGAPVRAEIPRSKVTTDWVHRSHASVGMPSLVRLPGGIWVAAWEESSQSEGSNGQRISVSFSTDTEGTKWEKPKVLFGAGSGSGGATSSGDNAELAGADWGPVLFCGGKNGRLKLFFSRSETCRFENSNSSLPAVDPYRFGEQSRDEFDRNLGGKKAGEVGRGWGVRWARGGGIWITEYDKGEDTWEAPKIIYPQSERGGAPKLTGNSVSMTKSGRWILPFWEEPPTGNSTCLGKMQKGIGPSSGILVSDDEGRTWTSKTLVGGKYDKLMRLIEPSVVMGIVRGGMEKELIMILGSDTGHLQITKSADMGLAWDVPKALPLLDPGLANTKAHTIRLADGLLTTVYNDMDILAQRLPEYKGSVTNVCVAMSWNEGQSWKKVVCVEEGVQCGMQMKNPYIVQSGCLLYIVYTKTFVSNAMHSQGGQGAVLGVKLAIVNVEDL